MFQWHGWPATSPFLTLAQKLYALDHEPALVLRERDPATGGYISRPPMIRLASDHRRSRAATEPSYRTPPAQKVDILHKKLSLNGALCAKPARVETTRLRSGGLPHFIKFEVCGKCKDPVSSFVGPVPTSRLDWIVVSYSGVAIGTLIDRC